MEYDMTPGQRELLLRKLQRHMAGGKIGVVSTAPQFGRSCIVYGSEEGLFATGHAGKGQGKKTMVLSRYIGGCGAGRCYCSVQPNGIITPCVYIPSDEVGDVRRQKFSEIWNNALFATLADREDRGDHCGVCDYRHYCGGCRARSLSYTGDIQAGDPRCVYNAHQWAELSGELAAPVEAGAHQGLVQLMAAGAVRTAAQSGELSGMAGEDVRDVKEMAGRLSSLFTRPN